MNQPLRTWRRDLMHTVSWMQTSQMGRWENDGKERGNFVKGNRSYHGQARWLVASAKSGSDCNDVSILLWLIIIVSDRSYKLQSKVDNYRDQQEFKIIRASLSIDPSNLSQHLLNFYTLDDIQKWKSHARCCSELWLQCSSFFSKAHKILKDARTQKLCPLNIFRYMWLSKFPANLKFLEQSRFSGVGWFLGGKLINCQKHRSPPP